MLLRDADEHYVIEVLVYHVELRYAGETAESVSLLLNTNEIFFFWGGGGGGDCKVVEGEANLALNQCGFEADLALTKNGRLTINALYHYLELHLRRLWFSTFPFRIVCAGLYLSPSSMIIFKPNSAINHRHILTFSIKLNPSLPRSLNSWLKL